MGKIGSRLRLTYYDASDGPRVMIFGPLDADFGSLQQLFTRLSGAPSQPCELDRQPFIAAFGGTKITLASSGPMFAQKGHAAGIGGSKQRLVRSLNGVALRKVGIT